MKWGVRASEARVVAASQGHTQQVELDGRLARLRVASGVRWRAQLARRAAAAISDWAVGATDAVVVVAAYWTALMLRFVDMGGVPGDWRMSFLIFLPVVVAIHLTANILFGAYGQVWEFASVAEALRLVRATLVSVALLVAGTLVYRDTIGHEGPMPLTALAVGSGLALGGMGAVRFRSRLFLSSSSDAALPSRALVVGTGRSGADLARRMRTAIQPMQVVGFVTTEPRVRARDLAGRPVLGALDEVATLVETHRIDVVVIEAALGEHVIRNVLDRLMAIDVGIRVLPDPSDVANGGTRLQDPRDIAIGDLLPRSAVEPDIATVRAFLAGRRVLVTGAGGSIGREIVRQLLALDVAEVFALDHDETHLYEAGLNWDARVTPILADICDSDRMARVFAKHPSDVVFHAAAHKHVPVLESYPEEAVKNNVFGTQDLIELVRRTSSVRCFVLISTDKAVRPTSIMGASKRVAELLVQSAYMADRSKVFASVRFGNVMGSRGSVIPTFTRQIRMGGPLTVSDAAMTRYFMTTSEAVELVLQASARATGGEVFVLDMGEPVRILDLARRLIRLAGLVPGRDIEIVFTGARPGEKIHESLSHSGLVRSDHQKVLLAEAPRVNPVTLHVAVEEMRRLVARGHEEQLRQLLLELALGRRLGSEYVDLTLFDAVEAAQ